MQNEAAANDPVHQIQTGSLLHPLYVGEHPILPEKIFPEEILVSMVMTLIIIIAVVVLTRNLGRVPSKKQAALELVVTGLQNFITGLIGPEGPRYLPLVGTVFLYILILNLSGLIPLWKSPTSNINVTLALAATVWVYVQYEGIRVNGFLGYLKHFAGEPPWLAPLNFPLHIIGEVARLVSLSIRLFGNMFGEDFVIAIIIFILTRIFTLWFLPVQFPLYLLAVFTSVVQALVFTMLTCVYIAGATVHEGPHHEPDHGHGVMETLAPAPPA